ncbi:unnamed protein product [Didymodactylos carnosus]|uniref:Uncharacterized protein n=1 Tax=Didymodactylos carnosus TaxID=1234261 RepID=A0A813X404_9BILA|nr:unnamed protein product [Didymodactylos carnosus]CAF1329384.1 unnamed protein product [Didymodactylos carnosus]CAF3650600.1 unnamed protein product [Didymodactylos carnosus]CAF4140800.1 unnamed protein product [Didymodactylos carnosus]
MATGTYYNSSPRNLIIENMNFNPQQSFKHSGARIQDRNTIRIINFNELPEIPLKRTQRRTTCGFGFWCCNCCDFIKVIGLIFLVLITVGILVAVILTTLNTSATNSTTVYSVTVPKYLCIYYGYPSLVDGSNWNVQNATAQFQQFDLIVFGDKIWNSSHGDHVNTQTIIGNLNQLGKSSYGYIDLGVTTQNLTIAQMQVAVQNWSAMGVKGIFWDDAGYDFNVSRSRQATMFSYCHSLNLNVMVNAWNVDDVLSGSNVQLTSSDIYILESYLISNGVYQSLSAWKTKADKCLQYKQQLGIQIACLSTGTTSISSTFGTTAQFSQAWFGTAMYNFDYFQATDIFYSSSNNQLYFFANLRSSYGTQWQTSYVLNTSSTHYYRSTNLFTLDLYGDGSTYGYGNFSSAQSG